MNAIERLRALEAEATAGPWFDDYGKVGAGDSGIGEMDSGEDAALIPAMRNALPALLAVAEEAHAVLRTGGLDSFTAESDHAVARLMKALAALDEAVPS